jgi:Tol biopolymer transport system component
MRRLAGTLAVLLALLVPPGARAAYGPASGGLGADIVSINNASDEQGDGASSDAAISADGRYVIFQTKASNFFADDGVAGADPDPPGVIRQGGIFRYDRLTGELQLVADGDEVSESDSSLIFRGAESPSVSADGRYIAFSTAQQLVPQDSNENVDVYVRDMDVPLTSERKSSGAYTLVSAKNGGEQPASYAPRNPPLPGENPGAEVWPNTSISADGRYVVFRTPELASDLPDHSTVDTPAGQLFIRDLQRQTTTLISRNSTTLTYPSGDPAAGAAGPASISADGSTVSWVSTNAPAQTRFLPGESLDPSQPYFLWRRWQEAGPTRRITGLADPDDPACPPGGDVTQDPTATGPCYGPLSEQEANLSSIAGAAPGLSADGYTVAFLAGAALRPNVTKSNGLDIFLTSMRPGVTRKAGTRELTLAVSSGAQGSTPSIDSLALSPDASTIAFTTLRDSFVLPEPQPLGVFRPQPTASDLYVIDLAANTLQRAVVGYAGDDPNESVSVNPTLSQDGSTIAFVSAASNLIFGDANGVLDAFTATLQSVGGTAPPPPGVNSLAGGFSLSATTSPALGVSVKRAKGGALLLLVETPGAGKLTAEARGTIPKTKTIKKRAKKAAARPVLLARASGSARAEGTTTLLLRLSSKYAKYLRRTGKLKANVTVSFTPPSPNQAITNEATANFLTPQASKHTAKTAALSGVNDL